MYINLFLDHCNVSLLSARFIPRLANHSTLKGLTTIFLIVYKYVADTAAVSFNCSQTAYGLVGLPPPMLSYQSREREGGREGGKGGRGREGGGRRREGEREGEGENDTFSLSFLQTFLSMTIPLLLSLYACMCCRYSSMMDLKLV